MCFMHGCKVRYFLIYYMQLVLKYILILFITCLHECHVNTPCSLSCSWRCQRGRDWGHKQRRLLQMAMTILRNSIGINELKDLLNKPLMPLKFHVPTSRGYWKKKLTMTWWMVLDILSLPSLLSFFSKPQWFIDALNHKRQCLIIILMIVIVIIEHLFI